MLVKPVLATKFELRNVCNNHSNSLIVAVDTVEFAQSVVELCQLPNIAIVATTVPHHQTYMTPSSPSISRRPLAMYIWRHH